MYFSCGDLQMCPSDLFYSICWFNSTSLFNCETNTCSVWLWLMECWAQANAILKRLHLLWLVLVLCVFSGNELNLCVMNGKCQQHCSRGCESMKLLECARKTNKFTWGEGLQCLFVTSCTPCWIQPFLTGTLLNEQYSEWGSLSTVITYGTVNLKVGCNEAWSLPKKCFLTALFWAVHPRAFHIPCTTLWHPIPTLTMGELHFGIKFGVLSSQLSEKKIVFCCVYVVHPSFVGRRFDHGRVLKAQAQVLGYRTRTPISDLSQLCENCRTATNIWLTIHRFIGTEPGWTLVIRRKEHLMSVFITYFVDKIKWVGFIYPELSPSV